MLPFGPAAEQVPRSLQWSGATVRTRYLVGTAQVTVPVGGTSHLHISSCRVQAGGESFGTRGRYLSEVEMLYYD